MPKSGWYVEKYLTVFGLKVKAEKPKMNDECETEQLVHISPAGEGVKR